MSAAAEQIRDQQRSIWDEFSAGWKKWDAEVLGWHAPFGDALIQEARLRPDSAVLDVAAGTGEPGLTAAALVRDGSVALTDISDGHAPGGGREGRGPAGCGNVRTTVSDVAALPFDDATFDAVSAASVSCSFPICPAPSGDVTGANRAPGSAPPSGAGPRKTRGRA